MIVEGAGDAVLDRVELSGATGDVNNGPLLAGYGAYCRPANGAPRIDVRRSILRGNTRGVGSTNCTVRISASTFTNMEYGIELRDSTATVDRSLFLAAPVTLDSGSFNFQNNIIARSPITGLEVYSTGTGTTIAFNTIVDNGLGGVGNFGVSCQFTNATALANNLIARNQNATFATNCTFPSSLIVDSDITAIRFKRPDAAPYDYHLMTGSMAVDMAALSALDHDFDGDPRPKGAGRDVGADEVE